MALHTHGCAHETMRWLTSPQLMSPWCAPLFIRQCYNFRNELTYSHLGEQACARREVHGHEGERTWCKPPPRSFIPFVDAGCSSDTYRCVVTYAPPVHPLCGCNKFANGAMLGDWEMCVRVESGTRICQPRAKSPTDVGGHFHFGCASDMCVCSVAGQAGPDKTCPFAALCAICRHPARYGCGLCVLRVGTCMLCMWQIFCDRDHCAEWVLCSRHDCAE